MSNMERNKGKLIPTEWEDILKYCPEATPDDLEWDTDGNYIKVGSDFYKVAWEVQGDSDFPDFAEVEKDLDGVISFHTYHYNGGAHWTEVIENALKKGSKWAHLQKHN